MKIKKTLILALVLLMTFLISCSIVYNKNRVSKSRPNVVLISIDTLRADHLSCYGYTRNTSPNIDELAQQGTTFLNAFSQSPKTTPSHMTIMTALYPDVHGVMNWKNNKLGKRLDDSTATLAEVLKNHGYKTVAFTGGGNVHPSRGFDKGFDIYKMSGAIDEAISWINNNHKKKFFLFFHTYAVHDPYLPPPPYNRKYDPDYQGTIIDNIDKGTWWWKKRHNMFWESVNKKDPRDIYFIEALYDGAISYMDEQIVGPLLEKLREVGIYKNTLIIFTSDHGEAFNEHNNFLHKDLYRETLQVPLIIVYPKIIPQNTKIEQLVRLLDIMPTIFDILDIDFKISVQGKSFLPAINGNNLNLSCYSTHNVKEGFNFESIRTNEYTYIFKNWSGESYEHLYDIDKDPNEKWNVKENKPIIIKKLKITLDEMRDSCKKRNTYKMSREVLPDSETIKRLESLGYIEKKMEKN